MFSKSYYLESVAFETNVCKHLFAKIPDGGLEYRPSDNQRSTLELLQHLTMCVLAPAKGLVNSDWSHAQADNEHSKSITADGFCAAMDQQLQAVKDLLEPLSGDDMQRDASLPIGGSTGLGKGLVNFSLKFISAYRLQLFVNIKAAGAPDLTTMNAWFGMDKPPE